MGKRKEPQVAAVATTSYTSYNQPLQASGMHTVQPLRVASAKD
ncbi:hypothetical protein ACDW_10010 [Acidovorax sp. DW039]|nr:hypothetical protein ACDW_10010 [Acidovorax sp. DW039]